MQIPKKLKVGGLVYSISEEPLDEECGEILYQKLEIRLMKYMPQELKEQTLFHEIIHAINNEMEEKEIEFLAQGIYQVLKDNKLLRD